MTKNYLFVPNGEEGMRENSKISKIVASNHQKKMLFQIATSMSHMEKVPQFVVHFPNRFCF